MLSAADRFVRRLLTATRSTENNRRRQASLLLNDVSVQSLEDRCLLAAGELDPTFGDGGIVVTNVDETRVEAIAADFAMQSDGMVVLVSSAPSTTRSLRRHAAQPHDSANTDIYVSRVLPNGSNGFGQPLDPSFGDNGTVRLNAGAGYDLAGAVEVLPDGKLLVAGASGTNGPERTVVFRLNADGSLDSTFGEGTGIAEFPEGPEFVSDLFVQSNGRIVVVGSDRDPTLGQDFEAIAFDSNGAVDTTFGTNGQVITDITGEGSYDFPSKAILHDDDRFLLIGPSINSNRSTGLARYNSDGSLDTTFSGNGIDHYVAGTMLDAVMLPNGQYLLGGRYGGVALLMINSDGSPDTTFGSNGTGRVDASPPSDLGLSRPAIHKLQRLPDGRIRAIVGSTQHSYEWLTPSYPEDTHFNNRAFVQFNADGSLDTTVDGDGWVSLDIDIQRSQAANGFVRGDVWMDDGRILLTNRSNGLTRFTSQYSLDTTYGDDGDAPIYTLTMPSSDEGHGVTLLPNGQIIVTGRSRGLYPRGQSPRYNSNDPAGGALFLRYDSSGNQDTSFDGYVAYYFEEQTNEADGAVVTGNYEFSSEGGLVSDVLVNADNSLFAPFVTEDRRLLAAGRINSDGQSTDRWGATVDGSASLHEIAGVVRLADGRVLMTANGVDRLTPDIVNGGFVGIFEEQSINGSPSYTEVQRWYLGDFGPTSIQLQPDGNLLLFDRTGARRYDTDGTLLESFVPLTAGDDIRIRDSILQSDGKAVVAGVVELEGIDQPFVARYTTGGALDPTFGSEGMVVFANAEPGMFEAISISDSQQILVVGNIGNSVAAARLQTDGSVDTTFGQHGLVQIVATNDSVVHAGNDITIQEDGAILVTGFVTRGDGREDVLVVRLQGDQQHATPTITHVTPDNGRHDKDAITNDGALMFHGRAVPGSDVQVMIDGATIGHVIANSNGNWTLDYSTVTLPENEYQVSVTSSLAGIDSLESAQFPLIIDTTAPSASMPEIDSDRLGPADNVTTTAYNFQGVVEEENLVSLFADGLPWQRYYQGAPIEAVAHGLPYYTTYERGFWKTWTLSETEHFSRHEPGAHVFQTQVEDLAGNLSPMSDPVTIWFVNGSDRLHRPEFVVAGSQSYIEGSGRPLTLDTQGAEYYGQITFLVNGTATQEEDYSIPVVTFDGSVPVEIPFLIDDTVYEGDELIELSVHNAGTAGIVLLPDTVTITIQEDDAPTVSDVPDLTTLTGAAIENIPVAIGNFADGVEVPVQVESNNAALFPVANIAITGKGNERQITVLPVAGVSGTATFTISAGHGAATATSSFTVDVIADDGSPAVISPMADITILEDSATAPIAIEVSGSLAASAVISVVATDPLLVPSEGIQLTGSGSNRTLVITPAANGFGATTISVTTEDSVGRVMLETFTLTVAGVNDPPVVIFSDQPPQTNEDTTLDSALLSEPVIRISDADSSDVAVELVSSNGTISFGPTFGTTADRISVAGGSLIQIAGALDDVNQALAHLKYRPDYNFFGTLDVSVLVSDSGDWDYGYASSVIESASGSSPNNILGQPSQPFSRSWYLRDRETGLHTITIGYDTPVHSTGASIAQVSSYGKVSLVEAMDADGNFATVWNGPDPVSQPGVLDVSWSATPFLTHGLRITVDADLISADEGGFGIDSVRLHETPHPLLPTELQTSFQINVLPVEGVPILPDVEELTARSSGQYNRLTITDDETSLANMQIEFQSGDESMLPTADITWSVWSSQLTVRLVSTEARGYTTLTVTATDEAGNAVSRTYPVSVNAPEIPTIEAPKLLFGEEDNPITFMATVSDSQTTDLSDLTLTVGSTHTNLVPLENIEVSTAGAVHTITVTPTADNSGSATIYLVVTDLDGHVRSHGVEIRFLSVNDAPEFTGIQAIYTDADTAFSFSQRLPEPPGVSDRDSGFVFTTIDVTNGTVSLEDASQVSLIEGSGTNDTRLQFHARTSTADIAIRNLTFTPAAGFAGDARIEVAVFDGDKTTLATIPVRVTNPSTMPVIPDQTLTEDTAGSIAIPIVNNVSAHPIVTVTSDDPTLFEEFQLSGTGGNQQLAIIPAANAFGSAIVTVHVNDGGHVLTRSFTATIKPVNDAPIAVSASSQTVSESADNTTQDVEIATLSAIDVDSTSHTFHLVAGSGDDHNNSFTIVDGKLFVKANVVLDFEAQAAYSIRIQANDGNATGETQLRIGVEDVAESLILQMPVAEVVEGGPPTNITILRNTSVSESETITLWTGYSDDLTIAQQTVIPAGEWSTTIPISAVDNFFVGTDFVATVAAVSHRNTQTWLPVTVLEDDVALPPVGRVSNLDGVNGFILTGISQDERAGWSVDSAGDINGDGFDDVIVGGPRAEHNGSSSGLVYVVFGKSDGFPASTDLSTLDGTNGFQIGGLTSGSFLGWSVSRGGDINGDGIDDLVFGTHATVEVTGATFVVFGTESAFPATFDLSTLDSTNGYRINGIAAFDLAGYSVASAGDINTDGYDDLIIGAPRATSDADVVDSGAAYVVFGIADPSASVINLADLNGTNGFRIDGISQTDWTGVSVDGAGDFNGDGYADLIIGDSHTNFSIKDDRPGNAYLVYGSSSGFPTTLNLGTLDGTNGLRFVNHEVGSQFGRFVGGLGDVNGDGYGDVIVSAHVSDSAPAGTRAGQSFVIFGTPAALPPTFNVATLNGTNGFRIDGPDAGDNAGYSARGAGDVNADGFDDIILGAPFAEKLSTGGIPNEGEAYTVFGRAEWHSATMNLSDLDGTNGFVVNGVGEVDLFAFSASGNGDINGDGFEDIIVGAPWSDPNDVVNAGNAYVIFGHVFSANAAMQVGDEQDNIITAVDGQNSDILVGGQGNDILSSDGGPDVLRGGAGDDILVIPDANFTSTRRLSGGTGVDTLRLDGKEITLDLTTIADNRIESIEAIDLTGSGPNALRLDVVEVLNISGQSNTLTVFRDEDDLVHRGTEWTQQLDVTDGLLTFEVYTHAAAILKVQKTTNVTLSSVASSIAEGTTQTQEFTFTRDNTLGPLTIDVAVAGRAIFGSDYTEEGATEFNDQVARLAFVNEQAVATITINSLEDNFVEGVENVTLWLPGSGPQSSVSATITDNDSAVFTINDVSAGEEDGTIEFSVALSNPIDIDVIVDVSSLAGSATADDFGDSTHQVKFGAGTTAAQIVVFSIVDDGLVEDTEHFSVDMNVNSATDIGTRLVNVSDSATATIINNDAATLTIEDATANEADGAVTFTVQLSQPIDIDLSLNVDFATDTAVAADFDSALQTVLFAAGNTTSQTITVDLQDDDIVELTESFLARLAVAASSSIGDRTVDISDSATGTITDNDTATFSIQDVTTTEDSGEAVFAVSISSPVDIDVTVDFVPMAGSATFADFNLPTDSVTFSAGTTDTQTVSVVIVDDNIVELTEQFSAALGINTAVVLGSRSVDVADTATATITDNDTAAFTIEDVTFNEAAGTARLSVSLSSPLDTDVMVDVIFAAETASSSDFSNTTKTVTFASGSSAAQTVAVLISNDKVVELTEAFTASLSVNPATSTGARAIDVSSEAKVYITDDDSAVFTIDDITAVEGETAQYRVSVSNPLDVDVTLELTHSPGTATEQDFDSQTKLITFPAGTSSPQILSVAVTDDDIVELTELFSSSLSLSATTPLGNRNVDLNDTAAATIADNDTASFTVEDTAVDESAGEAVFSVQLSNPLDVDVVLDVAYFSRTADDTDVDLTTDWLVFPAGTTTAQVATASVVDDNTVERAESFSARLVLSSNTNIGSRSIDISDSAIGIISDDDRAIITIEDTVANEADSAADFTLRLSNPLDIDFTVDVSYVSASADDTDVDVATDSIIFLAGSTTAQIASAAILDDDIVELDESFSASLSLDTSTSVGARLVDVSDTAIGTITDNDTAAFTIENAVVSESDGTVAFQITQSNPIDIDVTIDVDFLAGIAGLSDFDGATQSLVFPAGQNAPQSVSVPVIGDELVELSETFTASLAINAATVPGSRTFDTTSTASATITDDDASVFLIEDLTVNEGDGTATFAVSVSNPIDTDVTLDVTFTPDTGTPADFETATQSVTFKAGATDAQQVTVAIHDDETVELHEFFTAALQLSPATLLESRTVVLSGTATGTIIDNDTAFVTIDDITVNESDGEATFSVSVSNPLDLDLIVDVAYFPDSATIDDWDDDNGRLTFTAGTTEPQSVSIAIADDNIVEATESFVASLKVNSAVQMGTRNIDVSDSGVAIITDNDTAVFTVEDVEVNESNGFATLIISLSNPLDVDTTLDLGFTPETASSSDFDAGSQSVTFLANTVDSQTVTVGLLDDDLVEQAESFFVSLALDTSTSIEQRLVDVTGSGTVSIQDNDTATFTIDDITLTESDAVAEFTVSLSNPLDIEVIAHAVFINGLADETDFQASVATITIPAGATVNQTITAFITADNIAEATEDFSVVLTLDPAVVPGSRSIDMADEGMATIADNDTAVFTIEDVVVNESDGEAQLAVSLSRALDIDVVININYSSNSATAEDFDHSTGMASFVRGETSPQTVIVPVHDDDVTEVIETIITSLAIDASTPTHDRLIDVNATSTITIQDDDPAMVAGDVDGDLDFDANDTFLMHLVKLAGTNSQIDQSKGNSQFSATEIRSLIDGMGITADVDGDQDFDANDSFLVHLVKLAGTNAQIDQAKGSSRLSAGEIREKVNALDNSLLAGEGTGNFNSKRPERATTDANPKAEHNRSEFSSADFDQPKHAIVVAHDSTPQLETAKLWTEFRTWIDLL